MLTYLMDLLRAPRRGAPERREVQSAVLDLLTALARSDEGRLTLHAVDAASGVARLLSGRGRVLAQQAAVAIHHLSKGLPEAQLAAAGAGVRSPSV